MMWFLLQMYMNELALWKGVGVQIIESNSKHATWSYPNKFICTLNDYKWKIFRALQYMLLSSMVRVQKSVHQFVVKICWNEQDLELDIING